MKLQPERETKGMAPSRGVLGLVVAYPAEADSDGDMTTAGTGRFCHLLSCHHLAPIEADGNPAKVQKRRCLACAALEHARPPMRTLVVRTK